VLKGQHSKPVWQLSGPVVQFGTKQEWLTSNSQKLAACPVQSASLVQALPEPVVSVTPSTQPAGLKVKPSSQTQSLSLSTRCSFGPHLSFSS